MRRWIVPVLMISLLLGGCGNSAQEKLTRQRETLADAGTIAFTAEITADIGSEVFSCTARCSWTPEETVIELTAPENLAGIRARLRDGETLLEYEQISLGVGNAGATELSPAAAVPLLAEALRSGFLQRCWTERQEERELLAAQIYVSDAAELTVWYDGETLAPAAAEFSRDGAMALRCEITDFNFQ